MNRQNLEYNGCSFEDMQNLLINKIRHMRMSKDTEALAEAARLLTHCDGIYWDWGYQSFGRIDAEETRRVRR